MGSRPAVLSSPAVEPGPGLVSQPSKHLEQQLEWLKESFPAGLSDPKDVSDLT